MSTDDVRHRVGRLGSPNGLKGFIGIYIDDADAELIQPGSSVFIGGSLMEVRDARRGDKGWQVALAHHPDRSSVEALRGQVVEVLTRRPLADDEFWPDELIGLTAVDPDGHRLGMVTDVVSGPAQDRLVIETGGGVYEVPFVAALVPEVDLSQGLVRIAPVAGLLSGPEPQP